MFRLIPTCKPFKKQKAVGYYPIATKGVEAPEHEQKQHPPL